MKIALDYFIGDIAKKKALSKQLGVEYAVSGLSSDSVISKLIGWYKPWDYVALLHLKKSFDDDGLSLSVIEDPPFLEKAKLGIAGRDEEIEHFCMLIKNLGNLGIGTVCYNWMPVIGWFRTSLTSKTRGGALVTGYEHELMKDSGYVDGVGEVKKEQLWSSLEYFLKAVVPVAEEAGVRLALHPDDPPVPSIRGVERILTNANSIKRAIETVPSDYNGITLCQGTFAAMGEDIPEVIRYFGSRNKLHFAHFRDIRGNALKFDETFHDDGMTDMYGAIKAYHEVGFDGIIRPDHVPTMAGENNSAPGYGLLGNLFAVGYMKGLIEAFEKNN